MHPRYVPVDAGLLKRLYVDERLPAQNIACQLGCTPTTVFRRLRRFGIQARPRGPLPGSSRQFGPSLPPTWSPEIAWTVGVIATDGCLGRNERQLTVSSKDFDFLSTVRESLGGRGSITPYRKDVENPCFHLQWSDRELHAWLRRIGLTPAKSLTLGPLAVPDEYFADFFRGCVDGDGTVLVYTDRYHVAKSERYVYERLYVSLVSASRSFVEWIQITIQRLLGVRGAILNSGGRRPRPLWRLRYAKAESIRLLGWMYYAPSVPCLTRKRAKAEKFLAPLGYASARPTGRPRVGWLYNMEITESVRGLAGVE